MHATWMNSDPGSTGHVNWGMNSGVVPLMQYLMFAGPRLECVYGNYQQSNAVSDT